MPIAVITAELATALPDASGFLLWSRRAWGPMICFLDAWTMVIVMIIDQSLYPLIFISYLETFIDLTWWQSYLINLGYIAICCIVNLLGVEAMGKASKILSGLAVLPFVIFFIAGVISDEFEPSTWLEREKGNPSSLVCSLLFHFFGIPKNLIAITLGIFHNVNCRRLGFASVPERADLVHVWV